MRAMKWGLVVLLGVIVLLFAAWTVLNAIGSSKLNSARESLRARGMPTDLREVAPPAVPEEENAAPLYLAAFALVPESAGGQFGNEGFASSQHQTELRELFAKSGGAFAHLRKARSKKHCRFARDYSLGYSMLLPDVSQSIRTSKLLQHYAEATHADGKTAEARELLRDLAALADAYRDEPILVCQLVRIVCWNLVLDSIDRLATAADAAEWLAILPPPSRFEGMMVPAYRGEVAFASSILDHPEGIDGTTGSRNLSLHPFWRADGARYLERMARLSELAARPYPEIRAEVATLDAEIQSLSKWTCPVQSLMLPAVTRVFENQAKLQARLAVTRAGLGSGDTADPFTGGKLTIDDAGVKSASGAEWKKRS